MNITILNGNNGAPAFASYITNLAGKLKADHAVTVHDLADMDIKYCTGCWTCWWKTPGRCVHTDDMEKIYPDAVRADRLIYASPLSMGFVTKELKKTKDRMIPLLSCFMDIVQGEFHHQKRYGKYPLLGAILQAEPDTDEDDRKIVTDIFHRFALNFKSRMAFVRFTDTAVEEVAREAGAV